MDPPSPSLLNSRCSRSLSVSLAQQTYLIHHSIPSTDCNSSVMDMSSASTEALRHELCLRQARVSAPSTRRRTERLPDFEVQDLSNDDSLFVPERRTKLADGNVFRSTAKPVSCDSCLLQFETNRKRRRIRRPEVRSTPLAPNLTSRWIICNGFLFWMIGLYRIRCGHWNL